MICLSTLSQAQGNNPPSLTISLPSVQQAIAGTHLELHPVANGGAAPYVWHVLDGTLPPGVKLHAHSGVISGVPTTQGEYHFTLGIVDSGVPQMTTKRDATIAIGGAVTIDWKQFPKVQGNAIGGSVVVSNQTAAALDLTVVIVAVNSIGRATTLGYQHFTLPAQKTDQVIPFGSSPGPGSYIIHADAIAHHAGKGHVFRSRKQTSSPLQIAGL